MLIINCNPIKKDIQYLYNVKANKKIFCDNQGDEIGRAHV